MKLNNLLADIQLGPGGGGFSGPGTGPLSDASSPGITLAKIISTLVGFITAIAFIYFTFNLLTGALSIITAGSDKGSVEEARKKITNSLIGLVVTISAIFLLRLIGNVFGLNFLDLNNLIDTLTP